MKTASPAPQVAPATSSVQRRFQVRYYRRMKPLRVYPLVVAAQAGGKKDGQAPLEPVVIRPLIPGALVTPAETELDLSKPGAQATFQVTPLARGRLPQARVEVLQQGRSLQRIGLPMRTTTQRTTWLLALLTLLVPAFLLYATKYRPLQGAVPRPPAVLPGAGGPEVKPGIPQGNRALPAPNVAPPVTARPVPEDLVRTVVGLLQEPVGKPTIKPDEPPVGEKKDAAAKPGDEDKAEAKSEKPKKPAQPAGGGGPKAQVDGQVKEGGLEASAALTSTVPGSPGEVLEHEIVTNVPDIPADLRDAYPWCPAITAPAARALGHVYDLAYQMKTDNLSFWMGVVFLALTVMSFTTHRSIRGRRQGAPIVFKGRE